MIEIREKDAVTILNYIKDNSDALIGEMMEIDTGIKEERQREVMENLEIDHNMIILGSEGWELTPTTLELFIKNKKWLALEQSELNAILTDMWKKGKIKFGDLNGEEIKT